MDSAQSEVKKEEIKDKKDYNIHKISLKDESSDEEYDFNDDSTENLERLKKKREKTHSIYPMTRKGLGRRVLTAYHFDDYSELEKLLAEKKFIEMNAHLADSLKRVKRDVKHWRKRQDRYKRPPSDTPLLDKAEEARRVFDYKKYDEIYFTKECFKELRELRAEVHKYIKDSDDEEI